MVTLAIKSIADDRFLSDRVKTVNGYGYRPHYGNNAMLDLILCIENKAGQYGNIVVGYCGIADKESAMDALHRLAFPEWEI